jgi:hypothetical protein
MITSSEYRAIVARIESRDEEDINLVHVDCATGGCPVDFAEKAA